jgi:hypothetical protein
LGKAEVVKAWKAELKELGFVYRDNAFQFRETLDCDLHLIVCVQKNLYEDSYKVGPCAPSKSARGSIAT